MALWLFSREGVVENFPYPPGLVIAAALLGLALMFTVGLLLAWLRSKNQGSGPLEPDPGEPGSLPAEGLLTLQDLTRAIDDLLTVKLSHQTEILLESERRTKAEFFELSCKLDIIEDRVKQNGKELAVIEALLRDILQILNISVSETKTVSQKLQRHLEDSGKSPVQSSTQRLNQIR